MAKDITDLSRIWSVVDGITEIDDIRIATSQAILSLVLYSLWNKTIETIRIKMIKYWTMVFLDFSFQKILVLITFFMSAYSFTEPWHVDLGSFCTEEMSGQERWMLNLKWSPLMMPKKYLEWKCYLGRSKLTPCTVYHSGLIHTSHLRIARMIALEIIVDKVLDPRSLDVLIKPSQPPPVSHCIRISHVVWTAPLRYKIHAHFEKDLFPDSNSGTWFPENVH